MADRILWDSALSVIGVAYRMSQFLEYVGSDGFLHPRTPSQNHSSPDKHVSGVGKACDQ